MLLYYKRVQTSKPDFTLTTPPGTGTRSLKSRLLVPRLSSYEAAEYSALEGDKLVTRRYRHQWMDKERKKNPKGLPKDP
jgi:hypothetical protein